MRLTYSTIGVFTRSLFDITAVAANEYIPINTFNKEYTLGDGLRYYNKPSLQDANYKPNTLKNIKDGFEMGNSTRRININNRNYFISKGLFLSENGTPLMVCTMKKEAYMNAEIPKFSDTGYNANFSYTNYVLFYSTSFFTDPGLTPLNRRLQKEILQSCYEKGIEVRILSSLEIEKNTFARLFEVKKTKSLTQLEAYMEQVLPNFLHNNGEDNFIEQEFAPVTIHREELSVEEEALLFDNEMRDLIVDTTTGLVMPRRQMTELEELAAEAAQYDPIEEESSDEEESFDDDEDSAGEFYWEDAEHAVEIEEMLRDEEAAHTVSEVLLPSPHPTDSLVERMRPLAQQYNAAIFQNSSGVPINTGPEWQSVIQLIDDTE